MIPVTITAHLITAPVVTGPLIFDGLLLYGLGASMGAAHPSGRVAVEDVMKRPLPLRRCDRWHACSQVTPRGPEELHYLSKRPDIEGRRRYTSKRSVNRAAGPDKLQRKPVFRRTHMLELQWTAVGDPEQIRHLLRYVPAVGKYRAHGHGWIGRWTVEAGGPPLEAYARDVSLRHLPVDALDELPRGRVTRRRIPLTPPYYERERAEPCFQLVDGGRRV